VTARRRPRAPFSRSAQRQYHRGESARAPRACRSRICGRRRPAVEMASPNPWRALRIAPGACRVSPEPGSQLAPTPASGPAGGPA
jgi:hypothetical protein